jgi:hypothetical protein
MSQSGTGASYFPGRDVAYVVPETLGGESGFMHTDDGAAVDPDLFRQSTDPGQVPTLDGSALTRE